MSTVFSRRSFLKYTAVAAVAVAGTSLLGGCSGAEVSVCTEVGENASNTVLQVKSTLKSVEYGDGTATFQFHIENGRWNPILVSNSNFYAQVDGMPHQDLSVSLKAGSIGPTIKRNEESDYVITVQNIPTTAEELTLIFMPDTEYNEYLEKWVLDRATFTGSAGGEEQPNEGNDEGNKE